MLRHSPSERLDKQKAAADLGPRAIKWQQPSRRGRNAQQEVLIGRKHGGEGLSRVLQREPGLNCPEPPCNDTVPGPSAIVEL